MSILLLNGPPFSPLFWERVQERLTKHGLESFTFNWLEHSGSFEYLVPILLEKMEALHCKMIVAHGFAVPLALQVASKTSGIHFILSNGPLDSHKLAPMLAKIPNLALHPRISLPFLGSSFAFRRLVINPYVMNRDMIARLSQNVLNNKKTRKNIATYFQELEHWKPEKNLTSQEISLIWGTSDFLFPPPKNNSFSQHRQPLLIEGGAHFHPVERPWAIADQIQKLSLTKMS